MPDKSLIGAVVLAVCVFAGAMAVVNRMPAGQPVAPPLPAQFEPPKPPAAPDPKRADATSTPSASARTRTNWSSPPAARHRNW